MVGQIEQIIVFLGTSQSMDTPPPPPPDDLRLIDQHPSTSRGVGTSPDPPASDPHLPVATDPTLESSETHTTTQQQLVGGSTPMSTRTHEDPPTDPTDPLVP